MLPGMEGGPVTDAAGALIGALWLPIYSGHAGAEVPLIVPTGVLAAALPAAEWFNRLSDGGSSSEQPALEGGDSPSAAMDGRAMLSHPDGVSNQDAAVIGRQLTPVAVSAEGLLWSPMSRGLAASHQRRLASFGAALRPVSAARPPDLAPALALAWRGVVGVVAAGGRWASGVIVNP